MSPYKSDTNPISVPLLILTMTETKLAPCHTMLAASIILRANIQNRLLLVRSSSSNNSSS